MWSPWLINQADTEHRAREPYDSFKNKCEVKCHSAVKSWNDNWKALTVFLQFKVEIRKIISMTNFIESFNVSLRKFTSNKKVFASDDSAIKSIYLALM
jgi:transposase-like protein